jgi:RNA polymerase sigma-70 factor (ECF subfamily)
MFPARTGAGQRHKRPSAQKLQIGLAAYNRLVLAQQALLYNIAYAVLGDADAAGMATESAFVAAYRDGTEIENGSRARFARFVLAACSRQPKSSGVLTESGLRRELAALPFEERAVIVLIDLCGFSHEEAAQATNVSMLVVRNRLSQARISLRNLLRNG